MALSRVMSDSICRCAGASLRVTIQHIWVRVHNGYLELFMDIIELNNLMFFKG